MSRVPLEGLNIYHEKECVLFALGRNAMYAACVAMGLKPGDEILTPAYDCDGSLQPFRILNLNLRFFRIHPRTFEVDLEDLKKKISQKTKLIHIINYFGFPQPWNEILDFQKICEIPILEDNAYSLFSTYENKPLGTFGDVSVFSLRKNFPIIDGGMLKINHLSVQWNKPLEQPKFFYLTEMPGFLSWVRKKVGFPRIRYWHSPELPPPLYSDIRKEIPRCSSRDQIGKDFSVHFLRPMSKVARIQLCEWSTEKIQNIKKEKLKFYHLLVNQLSSLRNVEVLWPHLREGIIPFSFNFLVLRNRDLLFETLRKKYNMMVWTTLPQVILDQREHYPEIELLGRTLCQFNLPVENVCRDDFESYVYYFIEDVQRLAERI